MNTLIPILILLSVPAFAQSKPDIQVHVEGFREVAERALGRPVRNIGFIPEFRPGASRRNVRYHESGVMIAVADGGLELGSANGPQVWNLAYTEDTDDPGVGKLQLILSQPIGMTAAEPVYRLADSYDFIMPKTPGISEESLETLRNEIVGHISLEWDAYRIYVEDLEGSHESLFRAAKILSETGLFTRFDLTPYYRPVPPVRDSAHTVQGKGWQSVRPAFDSLRQLIEPGLVLPLNKDVKLPFGRFGPQVFRVDFEPGARKAVEHFAGYIQKRYLGRADVHLNEEDGLWLEVRTQDVATLDEMKAFIQGEQDLVIQLEIRPSGTCNRLVQ